MIMHDFEQYAARAFFATAWADAADESDNGPNLSGCDIMDLIPDDIDPAAIHAARTLRMDIERVNGATIDDMMARIKKMANGDRPATLEYFGHYSAMQAMGHGVGLADAFGDDVDNNIKVPYVEFSSASLERDYFNEPLDD